VLKLRWADEIAWTALTELDSRDQGFGQTCPGIPSAGFET